MWIIIIVAYSIRPSVSMIMWLFQVWTQPYNKTQLWKDHFRY
jgi:hypothetical protein